MSLKHPQLALPRAGQHVTVVRGADAYSGAVVDAWVTVSTSGAVDIGCGVRTLSRRYEVGRLTCGPHPMCYGADASIGTSGEYPAR